MTEEYVRTPLARISRYNGAYYFYIRRIAKMFFPCAVGIILGALLCRLLHCTEDELLEIGRLHFCTVFDGHSPVKNIRSAVEFALPDIMTIVFSAFFGFTMLASLGSSLLVAIKSARLSYCFFSLLPLSGAMTCGKSALTLFAVSKFLVLVALMFTSAEAEGFSYICRDSYGKCRGSFPRKEALSYILLSVSTAGFAAITDVLYLIFIRLLDITML